MFPQEDVQVSTLDGCISALATAEQWTRQFDGIDIKKVGHSGTITKLLHEARLCQRTSPTVIAYCKGNWDACIEALAERIAPYLPYPIDKRALRAAIQQLFTHEPSPLHYFESVPETQHQSQEMEDQSNGI
ncbi:MAG: hypothetical protein ABSC38_00735 [Verrucomicrobiia bacterium]